MSCFNDHLHPPLKSGHLANQDTFFVLMVAQLNNNSVQQLLPQRHTCVGEYCDMVTRLMVGDTILRYQIFPILVRTRVTQFGRSQASTRPSAMPSLHLEEPPA